MTMTDWRTTFDSRNTQAALDGSGISCPPLSSYADTLWEYWDRHLDPEPSRNKPLRRAVEGKRVMITGASDGIGKQLAFDVARAGGHVLLVARTRSKLEAVRDEIGQIGGTAFVHPCDLSDMDDIARMADEVVAEHGAVDILVNNAGRSIRRSIKLSFDRFHDFERTMQLNYFGGVRLILKLLPAMIEQQFGHIIHVSSIGVQVNAPRFSAYVASKAAMDAFGRCIAAEIIDDNVHITAVHMPLVRTKMIAPTKIYDRLPTLTPHEASKMICDAMINRDKKVATAMGSIGELSYAVAPKLVDQVAHRAYKLFPESAAAKGEGAADEKTSAEAAAFARVMKGVHW
jgi:short-subunit dehydrogenase